MAAFTYVRTVSESSEGSGANECELLQELGLLEAIYVHELSVDYDKSGTPSELSVILHPATADNVDQQYVCLTLSLTLPEQYPNSLPEIAIRNSRGVSDEHLISLEAKLKQIACDRQGGAMLYELIEVAKESLTNNNTPSCQCVICLHGFTESDVFTKTLCYHYFHSQCLARYLRHAQENEEEPVCAVCREPVTCDLSQLEDAPPPSAVHEVYAPNKKIRDMQKRMAALYRRQKEKGGIIDVEAENNKFLIGISQTPTLPLNTGISPVAVKPQIQVEQAPKSQNRTASDKHLSNNEGTRTDDPTRSTKNDPERPRFHNRSDFKQGGRGLGRGRGSRGRGQTRPYSSGDKDYSSRMSDVNGRVEFKGQSSDNMESQKQQDSEKTTDQLQGRIDNGTGADQSKNSAQNGSGNVLGTESEKGQRIWSGRQQRGRPPREKNSHIKEDPGRKKPEEKTSGHDEEPVNLDKNLKDKKSEESMQKGNERNAGKISENSNQKDKSPSREDSKKRDFSKKMPTLDEDGPKSGRNGQRNNPDLAENRHKKAYRNCNPSDRGLTERGTLEGESNRKRASRSAKENLKENHSIHGDKQYTDRALNNTAAATSSESGKGRTRHRNRNRRREPDPPKDSFQSGSRHTCRDRGHGESSQGGPGADSGKGGPDNKDGNKMNSEEKTSHKGPTQFEKSKPIMRPPPGFTKTVKNHQTDLEHKAVKPPPGFEHVTL